MTSISLISVHTYHRGSTTSSSKPLTLKNESDTHSHMHTRVKHTHTHKHTYRYFCISDNKDHTFSAANQNFKAVRDDLRKKGVGEIEIRREMSDGATDFKSRTAFVNVGLSWQLNGYAREHNSSVAGRGKGDNDRSGAEFKGHLKRLMGQAERTEKHGSLSSSQIRRPTDAKSVEHMIRTSTSFLNETHRADDHTVVSKDIICLGVDQFDQKVFLSLFIYFISHGHAHK